MVIVPMDEKKQQEGIPDPESLNINTGLFTWEIKEFVAYKRALGRKYIQDEYCLKAFNRFCAVNEHKSMTPQQLADAWCGRASGYYIGTLREFGLYLTKQSSTKSFIIPYANGDMPKPVFTGYISLYANEIVSFLEMKRASGLKYKHEERRLKDFDRFCSEQTNLCLTPQQLAERFLHFQNGLSNEKRKRSSSVIKEFGSYLTDNACLNAFIIKDKNIVIGPYAKEIEAFIAFKKSCGYKYSSAGYFLRLFDVFCALKENENLAPQQWADKWILKRGDEHPNTRACRVDPVRVFARYLTSIGHPKTFKVPFDVAKRIEPKPPYLFSEDDINAFFQACSELKPDEKEPSMHIVLTAAFLFMHCMGVRTCELKILMENVNLETGEAIIADAKTGERVVYMSEELSAFLLKYNAKIEKVFPCHKYLFPASVNQSRNDFSKQFKKIWMANVADTGHGSPRIYDFRHHLLYRNVEMCMRNGVDVNAIRPYLMRLMGHKLPESFRYYFHLSPPIQKEVTQIKKSLDWMIPDVPVIPYE